MHKETVERVIAEISENLDQKLLLLLPFMMLSNVLMEQAEVIPLKRKIHLDIIYYFKVGLEEPPLQCAILMLPFIDWA